MKKLLCLLLALSLLVALCMPVLAADDGAADQPESGKVILICIGIGVVVGLIVVLIMKSQMKTVRFQSGADSYVDEDRLELTGRSDIFLYQTVTRHAKPQNNRKG